MMEHVDWLDPDRIIIVNTKSKVYDDFIDDIRSKKYDNIRLLKILVSDRFYIRYVIDNTIKWHDCTYIIEKGSLYYIEIHKSLNTENLDNSYKLFNREDNLNKLLK